MQMIKSMQQRKDIHKAAAARLGRLDTNSLLLPDDYRRFIEDGRLYYEEYDQGLVYYVNHDAYYSAVYYATDKMDFSAMRQDRSVMIEEVNRAGRRDEYLRMHEKRLLDAGFKKGSESDEHTYDLLANEAEVRKNYANSMKEMEEHHLHIEEGSEKWKESILDLWNKYFPETFLSYDQIEQITHPRENARLICIIDDKNMLCATIMWNYISQGVIGRHLVVNPQYRECRVSTIATYIFMYEALEHGARNKVGYCVRGNPFVRNICRQMGYIWTDKHTIQYVLAGS